MLTRPLDSVAPPGADPAEDPQEMAARPRLMVPLDGRPAALGALQAAWRMAQAQGCPWLAVQVELPALRHSPREEAARMEQLRLAERLGAEVAQINPTGMRAAQAFLALARARGVTAIVLPRPRRPRWLGWIQGDLVEDLLGADPKIELRLVPGEPAAPSAPPPAAGRQNAGPRDAGPRDPRQLVPALVAVGLATAGGLLIVSRLDLADVAMLYILCITVVATRYGRLTALLASVLSVGALDYFFIPPRFTFVVEDIRHIGTFAVMLGVGWVVANLAERIRAQTRAALERERHTGALYRLGAALAEGGEAPAIQERVEAYIRHSLGMAALVLLSDRKGHLVPRTAGGLQLDRDELAVAQWALDNASPAGRGTRTLPGARGLFLPLVGAETPVGVLALFHDFGGPRHGASLGLPMALAAQLSLALERARLAEDRAEARLRADHEQLRSTLLSSVSHDLRTPLGTITGATTSLLDPGPEAAPGDQRMLLLTIHQESCRLERLVNNLLELTKLESGQVQVKKEWVPMEEVVGSAVGRMEEQLGDRQLILDLGEAWVPLDPVLLEQVLLNLLDNALKFSPPGSPIEIDGWVLEHRAWLAVADRGPGFAEGEEEAVFEKLHRGSCSALAPGAGLGLAICRSIIQAHGGTIQAANRPKGGAQITLTLPIEGAPPELPADGLA
jgi:two-component system sensor histidine kinase KdpD